MPHPSRFVPLLALALSLGLAAPALAQGVAVEQPWTRAAPQGGVGGAFMTLRNTGTTEDRLLAVTSPLAGTVELHETRRDGDVMRMRPVDTIPLPAGAAVALAPGGLHVMLIGLQKPLAAGERVPLTLRFERAGAVTVEAEVLAAGARGAGHGQGGGRH
jgi:copper(I)-binding protein